MRLATLRTPDGGTTAAVRRGSDYMMLEAADVGALLRSAGWERHVAEASGSLVRADDANFAPVVTGQGKIICCGINYASHIAEMGRESPAHPTLFAKFASTLCGANDDIRIPESADVDWEAELAVVIGAPLRGGERAQAANAIAGYTVANDVSMRRWQYRTAQWLQGKAWDATTPLGPELVTVDEVDLANGLRIECSVNGKPMQTASTGELVFDAVDLVAYASTFTRLEPGDVILTGTPGGVGAGRSPAVYLQHGDVVECSIEGIGVTRSRIVGGAA